MMSETFPEAIAHFERIASVYADLIQGGALEYGECIDGIERAIFGTERFAHFTETQQHALADRANLALCQAIDAPQLAAIRTIRLTVRPMIAARTAWPLIFLAAYRAANGRVASDEVERVVREEGLADKARYMAARAKRNAG